MTRDSCISPYGPWLLGFGALSACLSPGCAPHDPHSRWQADLQAYTRQHGGTIQSLGDLARDRSQRTVRPARIEFRSRSRPGPLAPVQETVGILVGNAAHEGATWYVFLVGASSSSDPALAEVRLLAVEPRAGRWRWVASAPDASRAGRPASDQVSSPPTVFPADEAVYVLEASGGQFVVSEVGTGRQWSASLTAEHR